MANVVPFGAYRYTEASGADLSRLATQPYDKITPAMRERYLAASGYNLVRIILGKPEPGDSDTDNVYTRAASYFRDWIDRGVLARDPASSFYPYFQEFADPDSGELQVRKGFIGLVQLAEYAEGIVHRHEQTLSGPKKDRLQVLRHTHAHFGQIFLLYEDASGEVDKLLAAAAAGNPLGQVHDEYGVHHRFWQIADQATIGTIRGLMSDRKLVIADGHHRYETALAFRRESGLADAGYVMATLVNMCSPGLRILATHRVLRNLPNFDTTQLLNGLAKLGALTWTSSENAKTILTSRNSDEIVVGVGLPGRSDVGLLRAARNQDLDVRFLHERILGGVLGVGEEAVREERFLVYVRGIDAALETLQQGAQAAFLLQPTGIDDVARISLSGGVMPQKSTDFYPKLLSGMTIYRLER